MSTARYMVGEAIDLSNAGDYRKAHKLLTKAIRLDPNNAQAYFERAIVCLNMDQDQQALPDLDRCLELDPHFPGARDWRARALEGTGSLHLAAHERLKSLREHPEGPHLGMGVCPQDWAECAEAFARVGDTETAIALLEEYLTVHSRKVTAYACYETAPVRALARLLLERDPKRASDLAGTAYSNTKHRCPMDLVVYALALEAAGQRAPARRVADEALAQNPYMKEAIALKQRLTSG